MCREELCATIFYGSDSDLCKRLNLYEPLIRQEWLDHRLSANAALYYTKSHNGYFFYFDATTSTQNLGNLDALYKGGELELKGRATDWLDLYLNYGYNYGSITAMQDPTVRGNRPPLLTQPHA